MSLRSWQEFVQKREFRRCKYDVVAVPADEDARLLLSLLFDRDDADGVRHLPEVLIPSGLSPFDKSLICSALVRAGVRHPGLLDEDLRDLHRTAKSEHHIELFADLNSLNTGLLLQTVESLRGSVARVVLSSSSVDVLHEYQGRLDKNHSKGGDFLRRAEMSRSLRMLDEMRRTVPVHIHQLPPGASRYFARNTAGPLRRQNDSVRPEPEALYHVDELTFISEDRQMIAAFWDYVTTTNPRLPMKLVTSDFSLAHVCVAEKVPFLFARSPYEVWKDLGEQAGGEQGTIPGVVWFDPFAPALRFCTAHAILWEMSLVFGQLDVVPVDDNESATGFRMRYVRRHHLPGRREEITVTDIDASARKDVKKLPSREQSGQRGQKVRPAARKASIDEGVDSSLQITLPDLLEILPWPSDRPVLLEELKLSEKRLRQIRYIGQVTELYGLTETCVEAGPALSKLILFLERRDYLAVNEIFQRVPAYDRVLKDAARIEVFPSSRVGGAAVGWAVVLGAAYKTKGGARYGLAVVSEDDFAKAVRDAHAEQGEGRPAVQMPYILDRVCTQLHISPVRFEVLLEAVLGRGSLSGYEAQRATVDVDLPEHKVMVAPAAAEIGRFLRVIAPGRGVVLGGTLVSSLVQRGGN